MRTAFTSSPRHGLALSAAFALGSLLGQTAHAGSVSFTLTTLNTPDGFSIGQALDINHLGQVVGRISTDGFDAKAVTWVNGRATVLESTGHNSYATGINDQGDIVGALSMGGGKIIPTLWRGGQTFGLPLASATNPSDYGFANDINNAGDIVGLTTGHDGRLHAALWQNRGLVVLQSDAATDTIATRINESGQVVGYIRSADGHTQAASWWGAGEAAVRLGPQDGQALALNDLGQIGIAVGPDSGPGIASQWLYPDAQSGLAQALPASSMGAGMGINNAGQVVSSGVLGQPFLWSASGGRVDLNSVLAPGAGSSVFQVGSINALGQIAVQTSAQQAGVLTPQGTLQWRGPSGGSFQSGANWDSGLGFAPNQLLGAVIAPNTPHAPAVVIGPTEAMTIKSLTLGGGASSALLQVVEGGPLRVLEGLHVLDGGQLGLWSGSDAVFAAARLIGNVTLEAGSGMVFNLGRAGSGLSAQRALFDHLAIDSILTLHGGSLNVAWLSGQAAQAGDEFDLLDWGVITGRFDQLSLPELATGLAWDTTQLYTRGVLSVGVAAVPEPSSWALLLCGLLAMGWKTRHASQRMATALSILALSACGGGGDGGTPSGTPSSPTGDTSNVTPSSVHATPSGAVQGTPVSAVIGASGGHVGTADGALTVEVPPGAFTQNETVAIQEISNQAHGGIGRAYRITPEGLHTSVPMTLRFHFSSADVAHTATGYLGVAYQDAQGLWHALRQRTVDTSAQTVSVQTTHFSDWSMFAGVQLRPPTATVHVGQSLTLQLRACEQVAEDGLVSMLHQCQDWDPDDRTVFWSVNGQLGGGSQIGTVTDLNATGTRSDAVYTAPAHVPHGDSMVVAVSAELFNPQQPDAPHTIMVSNVTVEDELARSCEWLRTAGELSFDIRFTPVDYSASDGSDSYTGQHSGHLTGRLKSQSQAPQLGWWIADLGTVQGQVSVNDLFLNPALRSTTVGSGTPAVAGDTPNPDSSSSGVVLYVDYQSCTYILTASYAVMATVTDTPLQSENGPTVTTKVVHVGNVGANTQPLYASYAVLHSIHAEQTGVVTADIPAGRSGYSPAHYSGALTPGSAVSLNWTIKPMP